MHDLLGSGEYYGDLFRRNLFFAQDVTRCEASPGGVVEGSWGRGTIISRASEPYAEDQPYWYWVKLPNGKVVKAQCEKISDKYKWGIPCDFTITVFEPNCEGMTEEQMKMLIFHELLHVKISYKDDGTETYGINPHDLEDFKLIIDRFGTDWAEVKE